MKVQKSLCSILSLLALLFLLAACQNQASAPSPSPSPSAASSSKWFTEPRELESGDGYESSAYYLYNEITDRHIYSVETRPTGLAEGEKVPVVIYVHGGSGEATTFQGIYTALAQDRIAAFSFECCGGNRSGAKSEGSKLFSSHYTSRITDLETVLEKVKTLDYVDTDRIFLFGESYGGLVVSLSAIDHPEIAGLILLSTGLQEDMMGDNGHETYIADYDKADPMEAIKAYGGDVICFNGDQDDALEAGRAQIEIYNQRESGTAVFYEMADSEHSYSAFSPAAKAEVIDTMRDFILQ